MFSGFSSVTAAVVLAMMVTMQMATTEAAAMSKGKSNHSAKTHRKSDATAAVETVPLQLDASALVPAANFLPLENSSISPWTYNVSHDETLFPATLADARCLLKGCLDSEGLEDRSLESRPIMRQVMLLRRVRPAGAGHSYHYSLEYRLVAVGCTCVRPIVQQQQ